MVHGGAHGVAIRVNDELYVQTFITHDWTTITAIFYIYFIYIFMCLFDKWPNTEIPIGCS